MTRLPQDVIEQDHKLEKATDSASVALMQHRWHWTLDESNPGRVSISDYAREVGRKRTVIHQYAFGFGFYRPGSITTDEAIRRANMSAETEAAVEAVAQERGVKFAYASKEFASEARTIREHARQVAEDKGTSTLDEIPRVAEFTYKARRAEKEHRESRRRNDTLRYIEMEAALTKARRHLLDAAKAGEGVEFDAEERELLLDSLDNIKRLLVLLDRAIAGSFDKGWKAELQLLEGGLAS